MKMQRLSGWLTQVLDALPWRRSRRHSRQKLRARAFSPRQAVLTDPNASRRQPPEPPRRYSTLPEAPAPPRLKTPTPTSEPPPASTALVPIPPPTPQAEPAAPPENAQLAEERRLVFARYLVRRGTFNEGFPADTLPSQYQQQEGT